ncbi:MAG: hypothetical protein KA369_05625 [Spirochaetes bacterium]|nr:hypothetical protein [Spirochaetota bacterium]
MKTSVKLIIMVISMFIAVALLTNFSLSLSLGLWSPAEYEKCFGGCVDSIQKYLLELGLTKKEVMEVTRDCAIREKCSNICQGALELKQLRKEGHGVEKIIE